MSKTARVYFRVLHLILFFLVLVLLFGFLRPKVGYGGGESEKWMFILSWRLKDQKLNKKNQFQHPPPFHFILFFLFSSLPSIWQSLQTPLPLLVCQVAHSLHISSIMEKAQLPFHKQVILIGDAFGGLITLREVFIIYYFFFFSH